MDVNYIITVYDKENYWPYLKQILDSYKIIKPHIALCYSGSDNNFVCDFKCSNRGHIEGDTDQIIGGYNLLKSNGVKKWLKLSVDSWMLDEQKVINIFNIMDSNDYVYAGNRWTGDAWWSTDIFFSRDNEFEFMKKFTEGALHYIEKVDYSIEGWAATLIKQSGKYYTIPEREPIIGNVGTRFCVESLSWTMKHDLNENIQQAKLFINSFKEQA